MDTVRAWFKKADNDLKVAEMTLNQDDSLYDIACFHAQQCAEKYLKGFLVYNEVDFPKTRSIEYLIFICKPFAPAIQSILTDVEVLSIYAVETRYPMDDATYDITRQEAQKAIVLAQKVKSTITTLMGTNLQSH
ncbi:MAG: HEPN domain-containing protein [Nitrospirae bacterium]|nr:HEPN domain-containing protein [Nitrospirota bacterium]